MTSIRFTFTISSLFLGILTSSLGAAEKFDWSKILVVPSSTESPQGNQILHFKSGNKPYIANEQAIQFVEIYLSEAKQAQSEAEVLRIASDAVTISGAFLEMGVGSGRTINFIAALNPYQKIYGFDSMEGFPHDWNGMPKGTFGFIDANQFPPVLHNVILKKGLFKDTLPVFLEETLKDQPIAFLHIDCEIYASTLDALFLLAGNIIEGTVIVFDEFYNYTGCENHEFKAFQEFLSITGLEAEYFAYNILHEQVAIRIKKK